MRVIQPIFCDSWKSTIKGRHTSKPGMSADRHIMHMSPLFYGFASLILTSLLRRLSVSLFTFSFTLCYVLPFFRSFFLSLHFIYLLFLYSLYLLVFHFFTLSFTDFSFLLFLGLSFVRFLYFPVLSHVARLLSLFRSEPQFGFHLLPLDEARITSRGGGGGWGSIEPFLVVGRIWTVNMTGLFRCTPSGHLSFF